MNLLITGSRGMLGTDLVKIFAATHHIMATDIQEMDVRDKNAILATASQFKPDIIVHLAAMTHVDDCERRPDEAFHTNTVGTQNVALVCQKLDIPMVYISTISVFDGAKPEPYLEYDLPNPQSFYAKSKYQGELLVKSLLQKYYIVRAGWMFGGGKEDKKFVAKIIELASSSSTLKAVNDKMGSPVYTVDFAKAVHNIMLSEQYGVYHAVNSGNPASRFEVAQAILEFANIINCKLLPVSSAEFPLPAHRPRMEAGRNLAMKLNGLPPMRHWRDSLKEYIQTTLIGD